MKNFSFNALRYKINPKKQVNTMGMKIIRLTTHWRPDEAEAVILLIDQVRDAICAAYSEEIGEYHQKLAKSQAHNQKFDETDTGDAIDF